VVLHPDDLRLATLAARGERGAVDAVVARLRCVPKFAAVCHQELGGPLDPAALEDAVQDALATLWAKLAEFRGEASLDTWAFRITDFTLRNACRRARRRPVSLDAAADAGGPNPGLAAVDAAEQMQVAMGRLSPDEAVVLKLKHYEELTFDEIGQTLAISPNTAKTRYYRALIAMRALLRPGHDQP
jgi:RNA polymerase sigma-70 factor (ECF subfamily)